MVKNMKLEKVKLFFAHDIILRNMCCFRLTDMVELSTMDDSTPTTTPAPPCYCLQLKVEMTPQKAKLIKEVMVLEEEGNPNNHMKIMLHARVLGSTFKHTLT